MILQTVIWSVTTRKSYGRSVGEIWGVFEYKRKHIENDLKHIKNIRDYNSKIRDQIAIIKPKQIHSIEPKLTKPKQINHLPLFGQSVDQNWPSSWLKPSRKLVDWNWQTSQPEPSGQPVDYFRQTSWPTDRDLESQFTSFPKMTYI
jgi:hypothetical protein